MEGRWASLALRAQYDKAVDFAGVSRDEPRTLAFEALILREASRRATLALKDRFYSFYRVKPDPKSVESAVDCLKEIEALEKPWLSVSERADGRTKTEKMFDYYNQVIALHGTAKDKGDIQHPAPAGDAGHTA